MRTASLVLGIIGAVLAVIFAIVFMFFGSAANMFGGALGAAAEDQLVEAGVEGAEGVAGIFQATADAAGSLLYILGGLSIVGAILGIVGMAQLKKRHVVGAILIIVAAIPSFFTGLGYIASIFFILAGIFAFLVKNEEAAAAPAAPVA